METYLVVPTISRKLTKYVTGAYLEGPVGMGKSEMIKDFAKTVAKHCITFGCFKQLDYSVVKKFFKVGLVNEVF